MVVLPTRHLHRNRRPNRSPKRDGSAPAAAASRVDALRSLQDGALRDARLPGEPRAGARAVCYFDSGVQAMDAREPRKAAKLFETSVEKADKRVKRAGRARKLRLLDGMEFQAVAWAWPSALGRNAADLTKAAHDGAASPRMRTRA